MKCNYFLLYLITMSIHTTHEIFQKKSSSRSFLVADGHGRRGSAGDCANVRVCMCNCVPIRAGHRCVIMPFRLNDDDDDVGMYTFRFFDYAFHHFRAKHRHFSFADAERV